MKDLVHVSFINDTLTFGIALNTEKDDPSKTKLMELFKKPLLSKKQTAHLARKFSIGSIVFYYIKERSLISAYLDQIKKLDNVSKSPSNSLWTKDQSSKDVIAERLCSILKEAEDADSNKNGFQQSISTSKEKKEPSPDFVQKVCKWNKIVEEKNKVYGGTKYVPFEL